MQHLVHIRRVLDVFSRVCMRQKLKKFFFFKDCIDYLRDIIQPGRFAISTRATYTIRKLQHSIYVTKLKSSFSLCNTLPQFVPNSTRIAPSLNHKFENDQNFPFGQLDETKTNAFGTLQKCLLAPLKLEVPRLYGCYKLETDACTRKVGCEFHQEQPKGPAEPISYLSCSLKKAELAYEKTQR